MLNVGSTRSSKTYSIMQLLVTKLFGEPNTVITVARKSLPSLKASAYRDFMEIMNNAGLYHKDNHNKTELIYTVGNSFLEFISIDASDKVKSRKRDYLFCPEVNELDYADFTQLALRTSKQIYLDLNPSHAEDHWIETKIKTRSDIEIIHSTYKDNPFLDDNTVFEIERLKDTDPNLWRIYGLGEMGLAEARIYTHFKLCDELPDIYDERIYGIDFGFNNPTAVGEVRIKDDVYYVKELLYKKGLTNADLIRELETLQINGIDPIYCDSAEPQRIEELRQAGFNALPANKDVVKGIDTVKSKTVYITKDSVNALKESKSYSWKSTSDGRISKDEPVKANDHFLDGGIRYPIHSHQFKPFIGFV